jgi:phospho-N-acetylmuramoyl-pentapeptide-transferase
VLYHFLWPLAKQYRILNVLTYISLRAVGAAVTALLLSFILGPIILGALKRQSVHQVVREGTPQSHAGKGTTPTMGGLIFLFASLSSVVS